MGAVETLFREYEVELDDNLCFQGFEAELAGLPGKYASPKGAILVATDTESGEFAGVVALRPMSIEGSCEMKRMYVRPRFRGNGLGRLLAECILETASTIGYSEMLLDTLQKLQPAIELYRNLGFEEIGAYYSNPLEGVVYMKKALL